MKENLKDLIIILSQEEERRELLKEAFKAELRSVAKDLLEGMTIAVQGGILWAERRCLQWPLLTRLRWAVLAG